MNKQSFQAIDGNGGNVVFQIPNVTSNQNQPLTQNQVMQSNYVTAATPSDNNSQLRQAAPAEDKDSQRRNPYINYDDNSIPNIINMTQSSQQNNQAASKNSRNHTAAKITDMNNSSLEIYDQDIFVSEVSASVKMEQANLGNQKHYSKLLAQLKQTQQGLLEEFQNRFETITRTSQTLQESGLQRPSVLTAGAASAVNVSGINRQQQQMMQIPRSDFLQLMSLKNQIEQNILAYDRNMQAYLSQYSEDTKLQLQDQIARTQKYKTLCQKHYYRADSYKTKHLEHEFEMRNRIDQLENAMDRVNEQANKNEELRYQKQLMAQRYEDRMSKIENIMEKIVSSDLNTDSRKQESYNHNFLDITKIQNLRNNHLAYDEEEDFEDSRYQRESQNYNRLHNSLGGIAKYKVNTPNNKILFDKKGRRVHQDKSKFAKDKKDDSDEVNDSLQVLQRSLNNINKLNKSCDDHNIQKKRVMPAHMKRKDKVKISSSLKRQIVRDEIKKLNGLIAQFRAEGEFFMNESDKESEREFGSERLLDQKSNEGPIVRPEALEDFASSQNSINKAFVQSKDDESDEPGSKKGSPIFNADFNDEALNDTSSFYQDTRQDQRKSLMFQNDIFKENEINFNPADLNAQQNNLKPCQDQNQTMEFDVSFSKELPVEGLMDIVESGSAQFPKYLDPQIMDPSSNFINSMEKTNEMINNFQRPDNKNIFRNPQKIPTKKKGVQRDVRSEKSDNNGNHDNSGLNFSNLLNQMNESNIAAEQENILGQGNGSFSLEAQAYPNMAHHTDQSENGAPNQIQRALIKHRQPQNPENIKQGDPVFVKFKLDKQNEELDSIDLSSIILAVSDNQNLAGVNPNTDEQRKYRKTREKSRPSKAFEDKKNKTQKHLFNTTMKISEINQISAVKESQKASKTPQNASNMPKGFPEQRMVTELEKSGHLSLSNSKFRDELRELHAALDSGALLEQTQGNEQLYNIVNISKDDAESIMNLLRDYVTVDLGQGKQVKIPKLNLALLPSNFPQEIQQEIKQKIHDKKDASNNWFTPNGGTGNIEAAFSASPITPISGDNQGNNAYGPLMQNQFQSPTQGSKSYTTNALGQNHQGNNKSSFQNNTTQEEHNETDFVHLINSPEQLQKMNQSDSGELIDIIQTEQLQTQPNDHPIQSRKFQPLLINESPIASKQENNFSPELMAMNALEQPNEPIFIDEVSNNQNESPQSFKSKTIVQNDNEKGLEAIMNLSNIFPQNEDDNGPQGEYMQNDGDMYGDQYGPDYQNIGIDESNTQDINERVENCLEMYNFNIQESSDNGFNQGSDYSQADSRDALGSDGYSGFLDLTNQGFVNHGEQSITKGNAMTRAGRGSSTNVAGQYSLGIHTGAVTTTAARQQFWATGGPQNFGVGALSNNNNAEPAISNISHISMRSEKTKNTKKQSTSKSKPRPKKATKSQNPVQNKHQAPSNRKSTAKNANQKNNQSKQNIVSQHSLPRSSQRVQPLNKTKQSSLKNSERSKRSKNRNFRESAERVNGQNLAHIVQPMIRSLNNSDVSGKDFGQFPEYENVQQAILEQINQGPIESRQMISKSSLEREDSGGQAKWAQLNQTRSPKMRDLDYQKSFKSQKVQNQSVRSPNSKKNREQDSMNIKLVNQNGDNFKIQTQQSQHNQSGRSSDHRQKAFAKSVKTVNSKPIQLEKQESHDKSNVIQLSKQNTAGSQDQKTNKKKIDIKNLINQSKNKRLFDNNIPSVKIQGMKVAYQKPKMIVKSVKPSGNPISPDIKTRDKPAKNSSVQPSKSSNSGVTEDAAGRTSQSKQSTSQNSSTLEKRYMDHRRQGSLDKQDALLKSQEYDDSLERQSQNYLSNLKVPQVGKVIQKKKKIGIKPITGRSGAGEIASLGESQDQERQKQSANITMIKNKQNLNISKISEQIKKRPKLKISNRDQSKDSQQVKNQDGKSIGSSIQKQQKLDKLTANDEQDDYYLSLQVGQIMAPQTVKNESHVKKALMINQLLQKQQQILSNINLVKNQSDGSRVPMPVNTNANLASSNRGLNIENSSNYQRDQVAQTMKSATPMPSNQANLGSYISGSGALGGSSIQSSSQKLQNFGKTNENGPAAQKLMSAIGQIQQSHSNQVLIERGHQNRIHASQSQESQVSIASRGSKRVSSISNPPKWPQKDHQSRNSSKNSHNQNERTSQILSDAHSNLPKKKNVINLKQSQVRQENAINIKNLNKIKFNFKQKKITMDNPLKQQQPDQNQYSQPQPRADSMEPQILSGQTSLPKKTKLMIKQNNIKIQKSKRQDEGNGVRVSADQAIKLSAYQNPPDHDKFHQNQSAIIEGTYENVNNSTEQPMKSSIKLMGKNLQNKRLVTLQGTSTGGNTSQGRGQYYYPEGDTNQSKTIPTYHNNR